MGVFGEKSGPVATLADGGDPRGGGVSKLEIVEGISTRGYHRTAILREVGYLWSLSMTVLRGRIFFNHKWETSNLGAPTPMRTMPPP